MKLHFSKRSTLLFCIILFAACAGGEITPISSEVWEKTGLDQKQVRAIIRNNNKLYAATFGAGVYYSDDTGVTWISMNNGLSDLNVYSITFKGDTLLAGTKNGVFMKDISENSWQVFSTSFPPETRAYSLYTYEEALYVGSRTAVFRIPYANPASYATLSSGFPSEPYVMFVQGHDNKLFAGTQEGLFIWSVNKWEAQPGVSKVTVGKIGFSNLEIYVPTDGEGVFRFANGSWAKVNEGLSSLKVFVTTIDAQTIYSGTADGVFKRSISESTWTAIREGLSSNSIINSLTVTNEYLIAGTENGVFRLVLE
jgi:ligand-binding sensor domain-containing protein